MRYTLRELADLLSQNPDLAASIEVEASLACAPATPVQESEHDLQARIFDHVQARAVQDQRWRSVICVPLGQYRHGQRPEPGLAWSAGFPDVFVFQRSRGYAGLAIELKVGRNQTTKRQNEWINRLNESGYYACVCRSYEEVIKLLEEYLHD